MIAHHPAPHTLQSGGMTLTLLPAAPYRASFTPAQPVAGFAFESQRGMHAFASDGVHPFHALANGLAFTPPGCSVYSEARWGGEYLTVSGDADAFTALLPDEKARLPGERFTGRTDTAGISAAHALRRLMLAPDADRGAIDTAIAAFLESMHRCSDPSWRQPPHANSMTPQRLRRVEEMIEARLSEPLSVQDMAAPCGLTPGFFLRAFKAATGRTPHRFLMDRRIARARRLIGEGRLGLGEIACCTGFSSQAHMTSAFKRQLGVTPSRIARR